MTDYAVQPQFIHLNTHTAYSLALGAIRVGELVDWAVKHNMPAIAVTDTNNMFGALDFSLCASGKGVQPIMGATLGVRRTDGITDGMGVAPEPDTIKLLVQNETGHQNLMDLLSRAYLNRDPHESPRIHMADLADCGDGLIALTGGAGGVIGRLLCDGQTDLAYARTDELLGIFGDRLYMEIQRHGTDAEHKCESALLDLAYDKNIPLVATNTCYYATPDMSEAHSALTCIADQATMEQEDRIHLPPEYYLKSPDEMVQLFADLPEAIANTVTIAKRCHYRSQTIDPLLPEYPYLDGRTESQALRDLSETGLEQRLQNNVYTDTMTDAEKDEIRQQYTDRLDFELKTITDMGFPGYFLIVADFIQWGKKQGIPIGPGRGSGAGSVVAWALTITDLDPIRWGLLFERFLNPERVSMPDFDIDFCERRRDEVIQYVQTQYGDDRVAQIITFGALKSRAVVRDVGRVYAMQYGQVDRICKLIPNNPANPTTLAEALKTEPALQEEQRADPTTAKMLDIALQLEGLYRHAGTHAAGVVIGDRPLKQLVPLYKDPKSPMPATQFNMKYVEMAGLVKFDFLGLSTLTVMDDAVKMIEQRDDVEQGSIDFSTIPLDDVPTYELIARAETAGVFQLESVGMRQVIRGMRPDRFEDLIALVSLYRPGPMENIPTYNACKHGTQDPKYLHPVLKPVLQETFGIPVYQEQVMQMAQVLSGYTLGGADLLRRAMGKKIKSEMDKQREIFVAGALEHNNVDEALSTEIFGYIEAFAGYGFNKSHAAAYALIAYHTAWLKAHYPVEFMATSMTQARENTDKLADFREELKRMNIPLLHPDINQSDVLFSTELAPNDDGDETLCIRYALSAIKGVGTEVMRAVVDERNNGGAFADIFDVIERVNAKDMNKRTLEKLIQAGAFDGLHPNRRQLFDSVGELLRHGQAIHKERESNQNSLFGEDVSTSNRPKLPQTPDWADIQKLTREKEAVGFYLSAHPLESYADICERLHVKRWQDIADGRVRLYGKDPIRVAGIVTDMRILTTKTGNRMCIVSLSDATAPYEVVFFGDDMIEQYRPILSDSKNAPLILTVRVEKFRPKRDDGTIDNDADERIRCTATHIAGLEETASKTAQGLSLTLSDTHPMEHIAQAFSQHAQPDENGGLVKITLLSADGEIDLTLPQRQTITANLRTALREIAGVQVREL